jgi:hypothetical protein
MLFGNVFPCCSPLVLLVLLVPLIPKWLPDFGPNTSMTRSHNNNVHFCTFCYVRNDTCVTPNRKADASNHAETQACRPLLTKSLAIAQRAPTFSAAPVIACFPFKKIMLVSVECFSSDQNMHPERVQALLRQRPRNSSEQNPICRQGKEIVIVKVLQVLG